MFDTRHHMVFDADNVVVKGFGQVTHMEEVTQSLHTVIN